MSILIKNIILENQETDILIEDNIISRISKNITNKTDDIINAKNKLALAPFYNTHTHAAMTLLRGYSDDLPVLEWLEQKIWPLESHLTEKDVYAGTKLACLEMIKTGTVFFNDMYWHFDGIVKAVEEMGIRCNVNSVVIDSNNSTNFENKKQGIMNELEKSKNFPSNLQYGIAAHSIYAVSKESLDWCVEIARKNNLKLNIHVSETKKEVDDCYRIHGISPIQYLDKIGFLGPNVVLAHSIWLNDKDIEIIKKTKSIISHVPTSNMKLSSGAFQYKNFNDYKNYITLGTDGCASNNNLDMGEEAKMASCLAKLDSMDPTMMCAEDSYQIATENGAKAFNINAGQIEEGKLADLILVDIDNTLMTPAHNLISNYVYSANSSLIDTTICDGNILMQNRIVEGEQEILNTARQCVKEIIQKAK